MRELPRWFADQLIERAARGGWTPDDVAAAIAEYHELEATAVTIETDWIATHRVVRGGVLRTSTGPADG